MGPRSIRHFDSRSRRDFRLSGRLWDAVVVASSGIVGDSLAVVQVLTFVGVVR